MDDADQDGELVMDMARSRSIQSKAHPVLNSASFWKRLSLAFHLSQIRPGAESRF
jgi:hypothetical protein